MKKMGIIIAGVIIFYFGILANQILHYSPPKSLDLAKSIHEELFPDPDKTKAEVPFGYRNWEEKIMLFAETYPELRPLAKKILKDGFISISEVKRFDAAINEIQDQRSNEREKTIKEKMKNW